MTVEFDLNGDPVAVTSDDGSLLDVLRNELGVRSPKDGCSPQGQCGCCTVLVDSKPRVACVTPVGRVRNRTVTTVDGLTDKEAWAQAFCDAGASQCGFCTPGIIARLSVLSPEQLLDRDTVDKALLAHLCRCTGWQTIREAAVRVAKKSSAENNNERDIGAAERRALIEGGVAQAVGPHVALGDGGFSDDEAPSDSLIALLDQDGAWVVADSMSEARRRGGKVQGRRTTAAPSWPIDVPPGEWVRTLQTTWVEPAYLEPDASWCAPGGIPSSPLGNGGAFGGKTASIVSSAARRLADEHGRPVRAVLAREDAVRLGGKRPPLAIGLDADGTGILRVARPTSSEDEDVVRASLESLSTRLDVAFVDVAGPPVSMSVRGSVWAEVAAVVASVQPPPDTVVSPEGATATAHIDADGNVILTVSCGDPLDETVVRSYCIGAAHMALGMVRSESIVLDGDGVPLDLTIRSFGIVRAGETPEIDVTLDVGSTSEPVRAGDAVFAAVLAAAWRRAGHPLQLPAL